MSASPVWIRSPDELAALGRRLAGAAAIAIDTEADSLHHYPERLCLVQVADADGHVYLVDPLALPDLEPLRPLCADRRTLQVFGETGATIIGSDAGRAYPGGGPAGPPGTS